MAGSHSDSHLTVSSGLVEVDDLCKYTFVSTFELHLGQRLQYIENSFYFMKIVNV